MLNEDASQKLDYRMYWDAIDALMRKKVSWLPSSKYEFVGLMVEE